MMPKQKRDSTKRWDVCNQHNLVQVTVICFLNFLDNSLGQKFVIWEMTQTLRYEVLKCLHVKSPMPLWFPSLKYVVRLEYA